MATSTVLALLISAMGFDLSVQPQAAPAVIGVWESESCVVQERGGGRTSSKSVFTFLEREWALEFVQFADERTGRMSRALHVGVQPTLQLNWSPSRHLRSLPPPASSKRVDF